MGLSIYYRSTNSMHPARAYEIKLHAAELIDAYFWASCEPVLLQQQSDGFLFGQSKPSYFPAELGHRTAESGELPDGTVLTLAEVLSTLSREHNVDWVIAHDYDPNPIGRICGGVIGSDLIEQLETVGCIGDLLDDDAEDGGDWEIVTSELPRDAGDDGPCLLKFPMRD